MKKRTKIILTILILAVIAVAAYLLLRKEEKPLVLQTEQPHTGYISESVTATGTVQPVDTVAVGTQVSGTLAKLYTDFNAKVKKGQLLAELDKSLFQAQVDQYKANLEAAKSQWAYQQNNFARQELLYKTGAIAKADYDNALYTYNSAKANVNSVQAQLNTALKNLSYAEIYSPIDGVVLTRSISVGQTVAASFSTPTLFTLAKDITKMQVQASVDEADIGNVKDGLRATFTVDAFLDDVFQGAVEEVRLRPTTSANVVTYTTIINAPNDDQKLKPGMTANITIYTREVNNALLIPVKALKFDPDAQLAKQYKLVQADTSTRKEQQAQQRINTSRDTSMAKVKDSAQVTSSTIGFVWVKENDRLVQKKVKTGLNNDTEVEVLDGLSATDVVVTGTASADKSKGAAAGNKNSSSTTKSPFMPSRPGRKR